MNNAEKIRIEEAVRMSRPDFLYGRETGALNCDEEKRVGIVHFISYFHLLLVDFFSYLPIFFLSTYPLPL